MKFTAPVFRNGFLFPIPLDAMDAGNLSAPARYPVGISDTTNAKLFWRVKVISGNLPFGITLPDPAYPDTTSTVHYDFTLDTGSISTVSLSEENILIANNTGGYLNGILSASGSPFPSFPVAVNLYSTITDFTGPSKYFCITDGALFYPNIFLTGQSNYLWVPGEPDLGSLTIAYGIGLGNDPGFTTDIVSTGTLKLKIPQEIDIPIWGAIWHYWTNPSQELPAWPGLPPDAGWDDFLGLELDGTAFWGYEGKYDTITGDWIG